YGRDAAADVPPVHLGEVERRASMAEEDRVGKAGVIVDIRKRRQPDRIPPTYTRPQIVDIRLRRGIAALVLGLGVDHQAVRARSDRARAHGGLCTRMRPVDVLPSAYVQST